MAGRSTVDRDLQPLRPERLAQVVEGEGQPGPLQVRGVDAHERGTKRSHLLSRPVGGISETHGDGRIVRFDGVGLGRQGHGQPHELLAQPVVELTGDATTFDVGGLDRVLEQLLPLSLGAADPAREPHRERDLQRRQCYERDGQDRDEGGPQLSAARRYRVEPQPGLEQQRLPLRR